MYQTNISYLKYTVYMSNIFQLKHLKERNKETYSKEFMYIKQNLDVQA